MRTGQSFSYETLTKTAEKRIAEFMAKLRNASRSFDRCMFSDWAYGVFSFWSAVTSGWQKDGDYERLEALTK